MKTKNLYEMPLDEENIIRIDKSSLAHKGKLRYAIDFLCEEGTPVYAAKEGRIVKVTNNKVKGGPNQPITDAGNQVLIEHSNSEFSHYAHLKKVRVKKGDYIKVKEDLGKSGNTGFSYGPHLHFSVIEFKGKNDFESLEIRWKISNRKV